MDAWYDGVPEHPILVLDSFTVHTSEVFTEEYLRGRLVLAHKADFEKRWALVRNVQQGIFHCTMVTEQILTCGIDEFSNDIVSCLVRRKIPVPAWMDKEIRNEFIGVDPATFVIQDKHIWYNASDVVELHALHYQQQIWAEKLGLSFLINVIRRRLVTILAETELIGFVHDTARWREINNKRIQQANEYAAQLNKYLVDRGFDLLTLNPTLADEYRRHANREKTLKDRLEKNKKLVEDYEAKGKTNTKAYLICKEQVEKIIQQQTEFETKTLIEPKINWGSPQQPLNVMKALRINPLPMARDKKTHRMKEGVGKEARNNWFTDNSDHEHVEFMRLFDKFKKIEHNIKAFGEGWIEKYVKVNGKVYTCFRQAGTKTGRFASGDESEGYFNLQQIPKETTKIDGKDVAEYRACFKTDPGRKIATLDYTGCEIVCMISLSGDLDLKKISELEDQHSFLGTKCWRAVYKHRYEKTGDPKWKELSETYVMNNKEEKKARDKFKQSGVFPVVYGVRPGKVSSIQSIPTYEAQIFIDVIEGEMPKVIKFVKEKAASALVNGYVIHNYRTNSRRWFYPVILSNRGGEELTDGEMIAIETAARNSPIQGTNVDIICEAIVTIDRWAKLFKVPIRLLGQVHDELIYDFPEDMDWIPARIQTLMSKVAQRYLIPEISMHAACDVGYYWIK